MQNKVDRAVQFMPFDALKGLQEELRRREYKNMSESKREISEEKQLQISQEMLKVKKNSIVKVVYYFDQHYFSVEGKVEKFSVPYHFIVVDDVRISFDDIYDFCVKH